MLSTFGSCYQLKVHSIMSTARQDANHCFVCGPNNPIGLKLTFSLDGDQCVSEFTPDAVHCGYGE